MPCDKVAWIADSTLWSNAHSTQSKHYPPPRLRYRGSRQVWQWRGWLRSDGYVTRMLFISMRRRSLPFISRWKSGCSVYRVSFHFKMKHWTLTFADWSWHSVMRTLLSLVTKARIPPNQASNTTNIHSRYICHHYWIILVNWMRIEREAYSILKRVSLQWKTRERP